MNNIMRFEGNEVEVFEFKGEVLFNPYHVGGCLDLSDITARRHMQTMNNKQVVKLKNSDVQDMNFRKLNNAGENFLTESGVYKLIFKSRKESAERFQDWVTDEVLPSIRKHGAYMTDDVLEQAIENPDFMIGILQNLKKEKEKVKLLQNENNKLVEKIEKDKPKVTFAIRVMNTKDNVTVTVLSKMISDEGFNISNRKLYDQLREWGYIYKRSRMPIQKYVEKGYFVVKTDTIDTPYGVKEVNNVKVTPKGQIHIVERILNENGVVA